MRSNYFGWWSICCCLEVNQVLKNEMASKKCGFFEDWKGCGNVSISKPVYGLRFRVKLTNHESSQRYKPQNATLSNIYFILGDAG